MNYSNVKVISWQVNTSPVKGEHGNYYPGYCLNKTNDVYSDVINQCYDIEARIDFFKKVLQQASQYFDRNDDTLNVFVAPEFLFRGTLGAYIEDLLNGWEIAPKVFKLQGLRLNQKWPGLFGFLDNIIENDSYKNCLFVIGTSIGASFKVENGDLKTTTAEAYNCAYVKVGGKGGAKHICRKKYMSTIDFLDQVNNYGITNPNVKHLIDLNENVFGEEGPIFSFSEIKKVNNEEIVFGLEICLDHNITINGTQGRINSAHQKVDIQLVPSCGMSLKRASLALKDGNSYAINCDGMEPHTKICDREFHPIECMSHNLNDGINFHGEELVSTMFWKKGLGEIIESPLLPLT